MRCKPRQGSQTRKANKTLNLSDESHQKLKGYAQSKNLPMSEILADFIDQGVDRDSYGPAWKEMYLDLRVKYEAFDKNWNDVYEWYQKAEDECANLQWELQELRGENDETLCQIPDISVEAVPQPLDVLMP